MIEPSNSLEANVGTLMRRASDVAGVCREIVMKTAQTIQGRKYVRVEGWQAIAVAYGLVASSRDVELVPGGVRAIGEVRRMSDGAIVSTAEGFVGEDEPTWFGGKLNGKDLPPRAMYAIRAMAQTRAISRACRGALSFVVTLIDSGLSTTPAEEMEGITVEGSTTPPPPAVRGNANLKAAMRPSPPKPANEPPHTADADFRPDTAPSRPAHIPTAPPTHNRERSFKFGRSAGTPLHAQSESDLKFYQGALKRDLASDEPKKIQYADSNRAALADVEGELAFRGL